MTAAVLASKAGETFLVAHGEQVALVQMAARTVTVLEPDELIAALEFDATWEAWPEQVTDPVMQDVATSVIAMIAPPPKRKGRRAKRFEAQMLSLSELPQLLDEGTVAMTALLTARYTGTADVRRDAIRELVDRVALRGAREVFRELIRQGAPVGLIDTMTVVETTSVCDAMLTECDAAMAEIARTADRRLARGTMSDAARAEARAEILSFHLPGVMKRYASQAVNEAFASGRWAALQSLAARRRGGVTTLAAEVSVDLVIQSAVLDSHCCDECAKVDGESFELGSARQEELRPPYIKCRGGDRCRCVQIALLSDGREIEVDEVIEDDTID